MITPQRQFLTRRPRLNTKKTMKAAAALFVLVCWLSLCYVVWQLERKVHYNWAYRDMVEKTVREMVKQEALKQ